jgi:hypothetical protein
MVPPSFLDSPPPAGNQRTEIGTSCAAAAATTWRQVSTWRGAMKNPDVEPDAVEDNLDLADIVVAHRSPLVRTILKW